MTVLALLPDPGPAIADCEAVGTGLLAQPYNSLSSLAFVAAGLWVIARVSTGRPVVALYGVTLIGEGIGSVGYHGPGGGLAHLVHDVALVAPSVTLLVFAVGSHRVWSETDRLRAGLAGVLLATMVRLLVPGSGTVLAVLAILATGLALLTAWRTPLGWEGGSSRAWRLALLLGAVALAANLLGRTGGPLCDPGALLQPHAVWHVLTAAVAACLAVAVFGRPPKDRVAAEVRGSATPRSGSHM